jgi:hypothetical protein
MTTVWLSTGWYIAIAIFIVVALGGAAFHFLTYYGDKKISDERANDPERLRQPRRRARR